MSDVKTVLARAYAQCSTCGARRDMTFDERSTRTNGEITVELTRWLTAHLRMNSGHRAEADLKIRAVPW